MSADHIREKVMTSKQWRLALRLGAAVSLIILGACTLFVALIDRQEEKAWRNDLGRRAVEVLAVDAARTFPQAVDKTGTFPRKYWSAKDSPCIFATKEYVVSGNRRILRFDDWPKGAEPACEDFYSSGIRAYDPQTTVPQNCLPVLTFPNRGGRDYTFLLLAADGAALQNLTAGRLSAEGRSRLIGESTVPHGEFYRAALFVRLGGHHQVSVKLDEMKSCTGFTLFRFSTDVANLDMTRKTLDAGGYWVGIK
jgi:hypothetical protein